MLFVNLVYTNQIFHKIIKTIRIESNFTIFLQNFENSYFNLSLLKIKFTNFYSFNYSRIIFQIPNQSKGCCRCHIDGLFKWPNKR